MPRNSDSRDSTSKLINSIQERAGRLQSVKYRVRIWGLVEIIQRKIRNQDSSQLREFIEAAERLVSEFEALEYMSGGLYIGDMSNA